MLLGYFLSCICTVANYGIFVGYAARRELLALYVTALEIMGSLLTTPVILFIDDINFSWTFSTKLKEVWL